MISGEDKKLQIKKKERHTKRQKFRVNKTPGDNERSPLLTSWQATFVPRTLNLVGQVRGHGTIILKGRSIYSNRLVIFLKKKKQKKN